MVIRPLVSSILSKQTGHVGSSTRLGVGGGNGFKLFETAAEEVAIDLSLRMGRVGVSKVMLFTNKT
jgi:hypothetical protein